MDSRKVSLHCAPSHVAPVPLSAGIACHTTAPGTQTAETQFVPQLLLDDSPEKNSLPTTTGKFVVEEQVIETEQEAAEKIAAPFVAANSSRHSLLLPVMASDPLRTTALEGSSAFRSGSAWSGRDCRALTPPPRSAATCPFRSLNASPLTDPGRSPFPDCCYQQRKERRGEGRKEREHSQSGNGGYYCCYCY